MRFTTERLIPDLRESEPLLVSHMARYRFAAPFVLGAMVLDVGCGCGYGTEYLATVGARRVIGVDIAPEAIDYAHRHYASTDIDFLVCDATSIAVASEAIDTVVCLELLEHVANPVQLLQECQRVLKPAGKIILSTPNKDVFSPRRSRPVNPWHFREFSRQELINLLGRYFDDLQLWGQTFTTRGTLPLTLLHLHVQRYLTTHHSMLSSLLGMVYGWVMKVTSLMARLALRVMDKDPSVIENVDLLPPGRTMYYIAVGHKEAAPGSIAASL